MLRGLALCLALTLAIGWAAHPGLAEAGAGVPASEALETGANAPASETAEAGGSVPAPGAIARATTPLTGASEAQRANIRLAAAALDGARVEAGAAFSFNDAVGPRTRSAGYAPAINGRGGRKLGGGVSQVATTLYLALKQLDGIEYLQKRTYGNQFAGGYADSGYDAIVTDYKNGVDFRFVNSGRGFAVRVRATEAAVECALTALDAPDAEAGRDGDSIGQDQSVSNSAEGEKSDAEADQDGNSDEQDQSVSSPAEGSESGPGKAASPADDPGLVEGINQGGESGVLQGDISGADAAIRSIAEDPDVTSYSQIRLDGSAAMLHNVRLACSGIYGVVLKRGDAFSFNQLVGPNTEAGGYQTAPDGRGERVAGGGVSVVASALWLAVKDMDGVEVTKKATYGASYNQSYVADPGDAIRTDYEAGADFRFRYRGKGSITLYTYVLDGVLLCEIRRNNS